MICYRIYTQNKNGISTIVEDYFDAFTTYTAMGVWKGQLEHSMIVEIITEADNKSLILAIARRIKARKEQETVLITEHPVKEEFI